MILTCLLSPETQATSWFGKVFAGVSGDGGQGGLHSGQQLYTADEIRAWLLKLNPSQREKISHLLITKENCGKQLRQIDHYARCYLDNPVDTNAQPAKEGRAAGIGSELFKKEGRWWLAPFEGGALYEQGITGRARLIAIGDRDVSDLDDEQISSLLKGKLGTEVCLKLERHDQLQTTCVTRNELNVPTVEHLWGGLLRIRTFRSLETRSILQSELEQLAPDQTLVIDLRESPGGDLYEALDCAALFLPAGSELATLRYREGKEQQVYAPDALPTFKGKLKLIVGADTASAAEIFAGILQYYGRAQLIGEKTYGKCVSQTILPLSDGTRIKLTNLEVYFPDGSTCQGQGLLPDNTPVNKQNSVH